MKTSRLKADAALLTAALIWGIAFVVQRVAAQKTGFFLFNGVRFCVAVLVLLPVVRSRLKFEIFQYRYIWLAGLFLFGGSAFQQAGLRFTTAGNAGFITGLYVVIVPLLLLMLWRQKTSLQAWLAALLATAGTLLLSTGGKSLRLAPGDGLILAGSVLWALHLIVVGKAVARVPVMHFAIGQYAIAGVSNLGMGLLLEMRTLQGLKEMWWAVLYTGIISIAIGYTLQAKAQQVAPATDAALLLSMEAVFAAVGGYFWLEEALLPIQVLGCALIVIAIVLAQRRSSSENSFS